MFTNIVDIINFKKDKVKRKSKKKTMAELFFTNVNKSKIVKKRKNNY